MAQPSAMERLAQGLRQKKSVMRLNPFGVFAAKVVAIEPAPEDETRIFNVTRYTHAMSGTEVTLLERREAAGTSAADFRVAHSDGIDNTGNFHWPAEEILAHVLLRRLAVADVRPRHVLELGAGVGLAGFAVATAFPDTAFTITDGNRSVVANAVRNAERLAMPHVRCQQLLWHDPVLASDDGSSDLLRTVDLVVGADCLFFDKYHADLKALLLRFLRRDGGAPPVWLVAPTRGTTLQRFVDLMKLEDDVDVTVEAAYDDVVTTVHERLSAADCAEAAAKSYDADKHLPLLVTITRRAAVSEQADATAAAVA